MKLVKFFVMLVIITTCASTLNSQNKNHTEVILLAGQSNMAGAGNYDELDVSIQKRIENVANRITFIFNGKKAKPLSPYKNKPSEKYNFTKRFGPELLFGLTIAEKYPNKNFIFIKRSQGGTALYGAWNPNWSFEKAKAVEKEKKQNLKLYEMHLSDIKKALASLENYRIAGFLWMQGENDAAREISAITYKSNLELLIKSYRKEFDAPKLPFIIGQINSNYGKYRKEGPRIVRNAMEEVARSNKNVAIIQTSMDRNWSDFPKYSDNVHYNTEGQKRLGVAFANALIELLNYK